MRLLIERAIVAGEGSPINHESLSIALESSPSQPSSLLKQRVKEIERERNSEAMVKARGGKLLAAKELGISQASIYKKSMVSKKVTRFSPLFLHAV